MSRKLLLADDSVTIQKVIEITFANQNFDLTMVGNGDDALEKAKSDPPDIILADIIMPGKNGYELCRAVKQVPQLAHIPILLLVGSFEPFDEEKARIIGADGWIAKPFETQALINKVRLLLENAPPPSAVVTQQEEPEPDLAPEEEAEELSFSVDFDEAPAVHAEEEEVLPPEEVSDEPLSPAAEAFASEAAEEDFPPQETSAFSPVDEEEAFPTPEEEPAVPEPSDPFEFSFTPEEEAVPSQEADAFPLPEPEPASTFSFGSDAPAEEEPGFIPPPDEEEDVLFLSEEDIVLEEEADEDAPAPEELSFADVDAEPASEDSSFAPLEMVEEEELPPVEEEPPAEPEPVFELEDLPPAEEESEKGEVEFVFDPFASEEPAAGPAEPEDAGAAFELPEEIPQEASPAEEPPVAESAGKEEPAAAEEAAAPAVSVDAVEQKIAALSDDELYAIVERVAKERLDRMALEILERIAWEVVPNMSESLIKEEIRKIKELRH
jgi:CheY-like chemotaxis protein